MVQPLTSHLCQRHSVDVAQTNASAAGLARTSTDDQVRRRLRLRQGCGTVKQRAGRYSQELPEPLHQERLLQVRLQQSKGADLPKCTNATDQPAPSETAPSTAAPPRSSSSATQRRSRAGLVARKATARATKIAPIHTAKNQEQDPDAMAQPASKSTSARTSAASTQTSSASGAVSRSSPTTRQERLTLTLVQMAASRCAMPAAPSRRARSLRSVMTSSLRWRMETSTAASTNHGSRAPRQRPAFAFGAANGESQRPSRRP